MSLISLQTVCQSVGVGVEPSFPPSALSLVCIPYMTSSLLPSLCCSLTRFLTSTPVKKPASHLEGEFISSIIYTIMLLQNIPHELLICVRLYVNHMPSYHITVCVCVYALFMSSVTSSLIPQCVFKALFSTRFLSLPSFSLFIAPFLWTDIDMH